MYDRPGEKKGPCVLCDYIEKEKTMLFEMIWSLGATSNLEQFYFKIEVK